MKRFRKMLAPLFLLIPSCLARIDSIFHLLNLICQCSLIHYAWFLHIYSIIINRSVISSKLQFVRYSIKLSYYTHYYNTIRCLIEIESTLVPTPETPTTLHWNVSCVFLCRFYLHRKPLQLYIETFCAFFYAGFTLFYCVVIHCHLPAFSFYTSTFTMAYCHLSQCDRFCVFCLCASHCSLLFATGKLHFMWLINCPKESYLNR